MRINAFKLILCLAAILFVAKPFVGFRVYGDVRDGKNESSFVIKIFAKRKPEFLDEATDRKAAILRLLNSKANKFSATLQAILLTVCAFVAAALSLILSRKATISRALFLPQPAPIYLLNRRLII